MTKEEITEGNKLICEFMGYKYYPYEAPEDPSQQPPKSGIYGWIKGDPKFAYFSQKIAGVQEKGHHWLCRSHRDLRYFNEWNWLMPVVEKIESLSTEKDGRFGVHIYSNGCSIQGTKFRPEKNYGVYFMQMDGKTKLEATWLAVTQFIAWLNQPKQDKPADQEFTMSDLTHLKEGDRVRHRHFGYGFVKRIDNSTLHKGGLLRIEFDEVGEKSLLKSFVKLQILPK